MKSGADKWSGRVGAALTLALAVAAFGCDSGRLQPQDAGSSTEPSVPLPIGEPDVAEPGAEPSDGGDVEVGDAGVEPDVGPAEPSPGPGNEPAPGPGSEPEDGGAPLVDAGPGPDGVDAGPPPPTYSVAAQGEACFVGGGTPCEDGLECAPIFNSGAGTCAQPCDVVDAPCSSGGICTDLPFNGIGNLICADRATSGEGCNVESLVLCGSEATCLADDTEPLGATCRETCTCAQGEASCASDCGGETCIVVDTTSGAGFCGAARAIGESCAPAAEGQLCVGDAVCLLDVTTPGSGTCRARCDTPGDADAACLALATPHGCFGPDNAGTCLPTNNLGQGDVCTLGTPVPDIALSCATDFACLSVHDDDAPGFGRCLRDCTGGQAECLTGEGCFNVETLAPGGGNRCITQLPRGTQGCNPPQPTCEDTCVVDANGDGICRAQCTRADCPGGNCDCAVDEECLPLLADQTVGICGTTADRGEACDEDAEVFCAAAPNEADPGNAFSICLSTCYFVCEYDPADAPVVNLDCPTGLECAADPTGRLLPTVKICVEPPALP